MKYFVVNRYFDNGSVETEIKLESEMTEDIQPCENENFTQYVDCFDSFEDAEKFKKDCYLA